MLCWTGYWVTSKRARERHEAMVYTTSVMMLSFVWTVPLLLLPGQSVTSVARHDWFWLVMIATVPSLGHIVLNFCQRFLQASISSAIGCLNPLVASLAAVPFLHQYLTGEQVAGVVVGIAAVAVIAARNREPGLAPPETTIGA